MKPVFASLACVLLTASAHAQNINYQDFNQGGFSQVGQLLQKLTPQQRAALLQRANIDQQNLQKLTPEQLAQLLRQLHDTAATIDFSKVDPSKLDMSKAQGVTATQEELSKYQQNQR